MKILRQESNQASNTEKVGKRTKKPKITVGQFGFDCENE